MGFYSSLHGLDEQGRRYMIELKDIRKSYRTDSFTQTALDGVSLAFRDSEFVAILGPSGSGKTTLLNIVGGLDHADSGDIVINGVSTKRYKSADWDTYRNHRIGFIFQSYNLIPHQSIKSNVELALTLSGVSRAERSRRAVEALERVGLGEHVNKRPNQLSGGQMQRVAIARALINDPDIVLADEPTGALDTETGIQVMDLLSEIAQDRLVVMVTHNPDLANRYANRIVRLTDGRIVDDTNPLLPEEIRGTLRPAVPAAPGAVSSGEGAQGARSASEFHDDAAAAAEVARDAAKGKKKHASMSFLTALSLSFNNLMTKKGRTFMTAFAGSIGIIGIAAILALSNGVNNYISDTEEQALTSYPLTITKSSFDISSLLTATMGYTSGGSAKGSEGDVSGSTVIPEDSIMSDIFAQVKNNNLTAFKKYLESGQSGIGQYVNTIQYSYGITPQIYKDTVSGADGSESSSSGDIVQLSPSSMVKSLASGAYGSALMGGSSSGMEAFSEMLDNRDLLDQTMTVVDGRWPESYDEAVLVLNQNGSISDYMLYSMGVYDTQAMQKMTQDALNGEEVTVPETSNDFTYDDALGLTFKVLPAADLYQRNSEQGTWTDTSNDNDYMRQQLQDNAITLKIVGVVMPAETSTTAALAEGVAYTPELTQHLMQLAADSDIVKEQKDNPNIDVFTGKTFEELQEQGSESFDMDSMFTIDEDALANAFSINVDTSSLNMGNIDLSGMDTSGMQISSDDLSIDSNAMSSIFSNESMQQVMAGAPQFSLEDAGITADDMQLTDEQMAAINEASTQLASGFTAWLVENNKIVPGVQPDYPALFQEYLQTESAQQVVSSLEKVLGPSVEHVVNTAMQNYLQNRFAPYISNALTAMMNQAAQVMATQMAQAMNAQVSAMTQSMGSAMASAISGQLSSSMSQLADAMQNGFSFDADAFANAIQFNMSQEDLTSLLTNYMNSSDLTYDSNMKKLGYAEEDDPESISIYPVDFPSKESVIDIIDGYNRQMSDSGRDDDTIQYSDIAGALMSSVTNIVNTISLVLIAFVSISLVVSSIMISIITYISVLERKKEIGILRAMGASKLNVANVFNAETIIEGLIAGIFAVAVVYIASVPVNAYVLQGWQVPNVMSLPVTSALALIGISVLITFIAGLIPSTAASRRDPVEALRTE